MAEELIRRICAVYHGTGSLRKTADELGFSLAKVRKALITHGSYSTPFSEQVLFLHNKGYSVEKIAKELDSTPKRVTNWLPYEKSMYNMSEKSQDAVRSENYRKRMNQARVNAVQNKLVSNEYGANDIKNPNISQPANASKKGNIRMGNPIRLHLKLQNEYTDMESQRILKKYGRSSTGNTIERDILIPSDMTLHSLHYAIQRLYGWQNSHLRSFKLPQEVYNRLTQKTVRGWGNLVGVLFQTLYPETAQFARYADDDYEYGSHKTWLRKKYTGPYGYLNYFECYDIAVEEFEKFVKRFSNMAVYEPFDFNQRDKSREDRIIKYSSVIDLTLDELNNSIIIEEGTEDLLERLTVASVLAPIGMDTACADELNKRMVMRLYNNGFDEFDEPEVKPVTNKLLYHYDYGDGWVVEITMLNDCNDLLEQEHITEQGLVEARNTVVEKYKPVCIHQDGIFVLDDVGGFSGFINFLSSLYESDDVDEKEHMRTWSSGMGWSTRKVNNKAML